MQNVTLTGGVEMPILGFGVYQVDPGDCERVVSDALEVGYRLIDTAAAYHNEEAVGRAIAKSGIPRDELFITTKLWVQDASEHAAKQAFETSLEKLQLDHLDLYLLHQPFGDVYGAWRTLEGLQDEGHVRATGVSNFYPGRLADFIAHNDTAPAVNQVETSPFCQQLEAQEYMRQHGVQIESWGPFAEGRNNLFSDPTLTAIARDHDRSVAQVVLRWLVQRGVVAIPKSVNRDRMQQNLDVFDFELSDSDMQQIKGLDTGKSLFIDHNSVEAAEMLAAVRVHD